MLASILTAIALSLACATLSVFVVSRRWAFIGEGISHSGFGGAGTAWLLALALPGAVNEETWVPACVVVFCLGTAIAIGCMTRGRRIESDTAIGVFMVASLAWGFLARSLYIASRHGTNPVGFDVLLFGDTRGVSLNFALTAMLLCAAIVSTVILLRKEILYYCFDAAMAEASGVRAGFIHYLLIILVTLTIVIGARVVGSVLVTALLVLPGATALNLTRSLRGAVAISLVSALFGTLAGLAASRRLPTVPTGSAIVLCLFVVFLVSLPGARLRSIPQ